MARHHKTVALRGRLTNNILEDIAECLLIHLRWQLIGLQQHVLDKSLLVLKLEQLGLRLTAVLEEIQDATLAQNVASHSILHGRDVTVEVECELGSRKIKYKCLRRAVIFLPLLFFATGGCHQHYECRYDEGYVSSEYSHHFVG